MGSADPLAYARDREGPVREVDVGPFAISATTVTVAQFASFVDATGYVTDAERSGHSWVFEGALPEGQRTAPASPNTKWWRLVTGASWRTPSGPHAAIVAPRDLPDHPVVHVTRRDAIVFCNWAGMDLPNEAQWEFAARGGLEQQPYPWGPERNPDGVERMNTWRGPFPRANYPPHAATFTEPARGYLPNAYGIYNTTGNVWEWTTGYFDALGGDHRGVVRGGSYLCHESYCRRYRTSARSGAWETARSGHIGFRVVSRARRHNPSALSRRRLQ